MAEWEVDMIKLDNCFHPDLPEKEIYSKMRDALNATGRPIFFDMCEWGMQDVWTWGKEVGNSWRAHADHFQAWTCAGVLSKECGGQVIRFERLLLGSLSDVVL